MAEQTDNVGRRRTPTSGTAQHPTLESHPPSPYLHRLAQRRASAGLARIAQSVEHILGKDEVIGSIPIASSVRMLHHGGFVSCQYLHDRLRRLR